MATEAHLLKLQTYLTKHLYDRHGARCIRTEILSKYIQDSCNESIIKSNKACPRCFTPWSEGNFSMKTQSKRRKRQLLRRRNIIMKCLMCNKKATIECPNPAGSSESSKKLLVVHKKDSRRTKIQTNTRSFAENKNSMKVTPKSKRKIKKKNRKK